MPKTVKGVTLTPEERAQVYPDQRPADSANGSQRLSRHTFALTLPDSAVCTVHYTRYQAKSHQFDFQAPLYQRLWIDGTMESNVTAIEAKGRELLPQALRKAQEDEQKTMRRKAALPGRQTKKRDYGQEIDLEKTERLAGKYAACMACASGRLIRIGPVHDHPQAALEEIQAGQYSHYRLLNGQEIVVGICNREAQKWQKPSFLLKPGEAPPSSASVTAPASPASPGIPPLSARAPRAASVEPKALSFQIGDQFRLEDGVIVEVEEIDEAAGEAIVTDEAGQPFVVEITQLLAYPRVAPP